MERYVSVDGASLWTCVQGDTARAKGVVLLCGGGPGCCDHLLPVSRMLEDEHCVIRFEQRGCGRSTCDGRYDLMTTVDDMESIRRHYGVDAWIVGGHSWGANLALVYALEHPRRAKALLYIAGNGLQNDRNWSETYHKNRETRGERAPDMAYPFNQEVNQAGNMSLRAFARSPDLYRRISRLETRALFLIAGEDIRPSWPAEQLCRLMPNAALETIPGAAHFIWLTHARQMEAALRRFVGIF